ncbi:MAG TPA: amidohydrolase/deacetylase family metallohydrolase [Vicinamibacterales bacterium]|nr:amidohydrolase/deacetylase family metallohydrolase [Vicinamibacterales bacterium]
MLTRRAFLTTAAGGGAVLAATRSTSGAEYDLLVKGGRVIDPSRRFDAAADVAIAKGRIAAVRPSIPASAAAEVVDASGALVTPGLIDVHTHVRSAEMPGICLSQGVTSLVDAGSRGADQIDSVVAFAKQAPNRVRVLINLSRVGVIDEGDLMDLSRADVALARAAILRHRDVVIGVKARLSRNVVGERDLEAVRRAQEITRPLGLPVMIHIGQGFSTIPQLLPLLKPGDIVTHMYAFPPNTIFDGKGGVLPEVIAARRRGIRFDIGNGRIGHFTWDTMAEGIKAGFLPDTTSSDWTDAGRAEHVVDFPNVMSKLLMLGVPLMQVIAMATSQAAASFPAFKGLGTLRTGAPADVSILELREGSFDFLDNVNTKRTGKQRLFTRATIFAGKRAPSLS